MTIIDKINEYQEKLEFILTDEEAKESFKEKIDQFPPDKIENLTNYWNQSLKNLSDKFKNFLKDIQYDDEGNISKEEVKIDFLHNAATKNNKYVKPFYNRNGENYLEAREDENIEVLNDYKKMDFTIYQSLAQEINNCITRLIMPRYRRAVEIEDLDRNFWVIGQNLTLLNKLILDLEDLFGEDLIAELCGLWDNIYRLWQAIFGLIDLTDNINTNEKIRIILHIPVNGYKEAVNKRIIYFSYNEILEQIIGKTNEEIIQNYHIDNANNSIVQLDCNKDTQVNLSAFFQMVLEKNFAILKNENSEGQVIYDIFSLSFTDREKFELNGYNWYKKTIKIEHLWIDFICDNGYIYTYTDNNFGDQTKLLNYDFNISIPMYINQIDGGADFSYHDIVRINRPIPYLKDLQDSGDYTVHMAAFNDGNLWIYKDGDTSLMVYDGFYGVDFSKYPSQRKITNIYNSYFYLSTNNLFNIKMSSSDLINCKHPIDGQTYIENEYINTFTEKDFTVNLRYLTGRDNGQEIEILTTKDKVIFPVKYIPKVTAKNDFIGKITYTINDDYTKNPPELILELNKKTGSLKIDLNHIKKKNSSVIDIDKLWNKISTDLETYYKNKAGALQNYEMKVFLPWIYTNPWNNNSSTSVYNAGVKYLFIVCVYKINNKLYFKKLFTINKKIDFFHESSIQKAIQPITDAEGYSATGGYFPFFNGVWHGGFQVDILNYAVNSQNDNFDIILKRLEGKIRYHKFEENGKTNEISAMVFAGNIYNKNWKIDMIKGYPYKLDGYEIDKESSAEEIDEKYRNRNPNNFIYAGKIENGRVKIKNTGVYLTTNTLPWSENADWE
ncbi:MAG: hypothetical protein ACI311_04710 [Bacilli bacterium]